MSDLTFDTREFDISLKSIELTIDDLKKIEQKGASVLIAGMRQRAAKDTGDMSESVKSHVVNANAEKIEDEVGPEKEYAIYNEYGTGIYAEAGNGRKTPWVYRDRNGQFHTTSGMHPHPFVRPTVREDGDKCNDAMSKEFGRLVLQRWQK